jgi:prefoldin subunit 5
MSENNPDFLEQNRRINELTRKVGKLEISMNTLEQAIEPQGWISQAFEKVEEHLDEQDRKINRLEQNMNHNIAELRSSLNHIIDHLTKISDLPEE